MNQGIKMEVQPRICLTLLAAAILPAAGSINYIEYDVPIIFQNPEYPTGCEPVAAVMLLNFYGFNITPEEFIARMPMGPYPSLAKDGKMYGPDPREVFVGHPSRKSSWGIFAGGIKKTIDALLADLSGTSHGNNRPLLNNLACIDISGCTVDELIELLQQGKPVLVWASRNMEEPEPGTSWYIEGTGELFVWPKKEHCYVLLGCQQNNLLIFNDPLEGRVIYSRDSFEKVFEALGRQALYLDFYN